MCIADKSWSSFQIVHGEDSVVLRVADLLPESHLLVKLIFRQRQTFTGSIGLFVDNAVLRQGCHPVVLYLPDHDKQSLVGSVTPGRLKALGLPAILLEFTQFDEHLIHYRNDDALLPSPLRSVRQQFSKVNRSVREWHHLQALEDKPHVTWPLSLADKRVVWRERWRVRNDALLIQAVDWNDLEDVEEALIIFLHNNPPSIDNSGWSSLLTLLASIEKCLRRDRARLDFRLANLLLHLLSRCGSIGSCSPALAYALCEASVVKDANSLWLSEVAEKMLLTACKNDARLALRMAWYAHGHAAYGSRQTGAPAQSPSHHASLQNKILAIMDNKARGIFERSLLLMRRLASMVDSVKGSKQPRLQQTEMLRQLLASQTLLHHPHHHTSDQLDQNDDDGVDAASPHHHYLPFDWEGKEALQEVCIDETQVYKSRAMPVRIVFSLADAKEKQGDMRAALIYKTGDDMRQDVFIVSLIQIFNDGWRECGMDLHILVYEAVCTGVGQGCVQYVPSVTLASLSSSSSDPNSSNTSNKGYPKNLII